MKIEIEINFSRLDFEEIYFKNNQGNYMKSPTTKSAFNLLIFSTFTLVSLLLYSLTNDPGVLLVFAFILFIIAFGNYLNTFRVLYKWRTEINDYIDREEKYSTHKLILSDNSFSVIQDEKETIENWNNFTSVKISDEYITMEGKENFLIPSKSMPINEYQRLKEVISEKTK